jgi:hypothetical protein
MNTPKLMVVTIELFVPVCANVRTRATSSTCVSTYLSPWTRNLREKLTVFHLVTKIPAVHRARKFIVIFTRERHLSPLGTRRKQSFNGSSFIFVLVLQYHEPTYRSRFSVCLRAWRPRSQSSNPR